jgi:hypothetical protein
MRTIPMPLLLGRIAIGDWLTVLIGVVSLAVLFRWNVSNPSLMAAAAGVPPLRLKTLAEIPLGGHTTRLDYASVDARRHLLFVAHLGDSEVIVVDTQARRVEKRIPGVSKVHGVLAIPELGRLYASATGSRRFVDP